MSLSAKRGLFSSTKGDDRTGLRRAGGRFRRARDAPYSLKIINLNSSRGGPVGPNESDRSSPAGLERFEHHQNDDHADHQQLGPVRPGGTPVVECRRQVRRHGARCKCSLESGVEGPTGRQEHRRHERRDCGIEEDRDQQPAVTAA